MKKILLTLTLLIAGLTSYSAENEIRLAANIGGGTTLLKHKDTGEKDSSNGKRHGYIQGAVDISGHKVGYVSLTSTTELNFGGGVEIGGGKFLGMTEEKNTNQSEYFYINPYIKLEIGDEIAEDFKLYGGIKGGIIDTITTKSTVLKPGGLENRVGISAKIYALGVYKEKYTVEVGTGVGNSLGYLSIGLNFGL